MQQRIELTNVQTPSGPLFPEADQPWTPMYVDVLHDWEGAYGFDALDFGGNPAMAASRSRMKQIFDGRYAFRRISAETLPRWQTRLQAICDSNIARYERGMTMFANVSATEDLRASRTVSETTHTADSGTDTTTYGRTTATSGTTRDRSIDTPQSAINRSADYADSLQETTDAGTSTAGGSDSFTHGLQRDGLNSVTEHTQGEGGLMIATREAWRAWEDLCLLFVKEFENAFLNVFDY